MRLSMVLCLAVASGASAFALSCSSSSNGASGADGGGDSDATFDAGTGADLSEASSDEAEAGPPQALVRIAHFSPGAPSIDVCLAPHGTGAFVGPLLAQFASDAGLADDATLVGLSYGQVSAYVAIPPGTYDVRVVSAGANSCAAVLAIVATGAGQAVILDGGASADAGDDVSTDAGADGGADASVDAGGSADASDDIDVGAVGDAGASADAGPSADAGASVTLAGTTTLGAIGPDDSVTLLVAGEPVPTGSDAPLRVTALHDDSELATGASSVRFVNALPSVASADFGFGSFAGSWLPLFTGARFGAASTQAAPNQGTADANGYLPVAPFGPQLVSARATSNATGDLVASSAATVQAGAIVTFVAFGGATADAAYPATLLVCTDNQPSGGLLSDCSVSP